MLSDTPLTIVPPRHRRRSTDAQSPLEGSSTRADMQAIDREVLQRRLEDAQSGVRSFRDVLRHAARMFSQREPQPQVSLYGSADRSIVYVAHWCSQGALISVDFLLELSAVLQDVVCDAAALGAERGLLDSSHRVRYG